MMRPRILPSTVLVLASLMTSGCLGVASVDEDDVAHTDDALTEWAPPPECDEGVEMTPDRAAAEVGREFADFQMRVWTRPRIGDEPTSGPYLPVARGYFWSEHGGVRWWPLLHDARGTAHVVASDRLDLRFHFAKDVSMNVVLPSSPAPTVATTMGTAKLWIGSERSSDRSADALGHFDHVRLTTTCLYASQTGRTVRKPDGTWEEILVVVSGTRPVRQGRENDR